MNDFQSFPDLAPWEYEALKASIRRYGVILPVVKDENGDIIDGHQRERACRELGIERLPGPDASLGSPRTRSGTTPSSSTSSDAGSNRQQMRDLIAAELRRTPDLSSNWLAQTLGTTDKTVEAVRQETDRNFGDSEVGAAAGQGRQVSPCDPDRDAHRQGGGTGAGSPPDPRRRRPEERPGTSAGREEGEADAEVETTRGVRSPASWRWRHPPLPLPVPASSKRSPGSSRTRST